MTACGCNIPAVAARTGLTPYRGASTDVPIGGESVIALYGPLVGGIIQNPSTIGGQGISPIVQSGTIPVTRSVGAIGSYSPNYHVAIGGRSTITTQVPAFVYGPPEPLYVSLAGPASLVEGGTTKILMPGDSFAIPANFTGNVWVNAGTSGHRFSAIAVQPVTAYPPSPYTGAFPPTGPSGKTTTIPSYLYDEYTDDDDLQALVDSYNQQTQSFVDWFNDINLPIYTGLSGGLLDWVGEGLYGIKRPTLYSGRYLSYGPINTYAINSFAINSFTKIGQFNDIAVTNDDVYKRIITWGFYKGDGHQFSIPWLKRRIYRFLYGANGQDASGGLDQISVVFGANGTLSITIVTGIRRVIGGSVIGLSGINSDAINDLETSETDRMVPAMAAVFKEAIDTGVLELPTQYAVTCRIGIIGAAG